MAVRIEKKAKVWTVIHSRSEARNAMDPESADALVAAFTQFDKDPDAAVAVLWGEGGAFCAVTTPHTGRSPTTAAPIAVPQYTSPIPRRASRNPTVAPSPAPATCDSGDRTRVDRVMLDVAPLPETVFSQHRA